MAGASAVLWVLAGATAGAGSGGEALSYGWALFKVVAALLLVCGLVVGGAVLARRALERRGGPGPHRMRVLERLALGPRQALWLVEVDGRRLLLGAGETGLRTLADLDAGDHGAQPAMAGPAAMDEDRFGGCHDGRTGDEGRHGQG